MSDSNYSARSESVVGLLLMEDLLSALERSQNFLLYDSSVVGESYRLYLLNGDRAIEAAEFFVAHDLTEASEIAAFIFALCADVFSDYELWRGAEKITPIRNSVSGT